MDLYRLERPDQVWPLGWSDLDDAGEIVLVEWPERAEALLPERRIDVWIHPSSAGEAHRDLLIRTVGGAAWPDARVPSFDGARI